MTQANHLECGDIIIIALPDHRPKGHEQEGTRPAVIVGITKAETRYPMIIIVPLTTQTGTWSNNNPNLYPILEQGAGGLNQPSIALLDQIRAIDISRIVGYLGTLTTEHYAPIRKGIKHMLEF